MKKVELKICGITRKVDAELVQGLGADYLGIVCVESSKRFVPNNKLPEIITNIKIPKVGVFRDANIEYITQAVQLGKFDIIQLHGNEDENFVSNLKAKFPNIKIWKAFFLPNLKAKDFPVDRVLIDGNTPGSGKVCDWKLAKEIAKERDILLAGGINIENVVEAINEVNPLGIDIASGVESSAGIKDKNLLEELFRRIK